MDAFMGFFDLTFNLSDINSPLTIGHTLCIYKETVLVPLAASTILPLS
jgi:hypothetical protein